MPGSTIPEGPLERLGDEVFHNRDGRGLGPTLGPGLSAEHQRELVKRILGEGASFEGEALPTRPAPPVGSIGSSDELEDLSARTADEPDGLNETQAEMYAHARAQGGPRKLGGDTEGL